MDRSSFAGQRQAQLSDGGHFFRLRQLLCPPAFADVIIYDDCDLS